MLLMYRRIGPFLLGVALLFGSGCARSYDGTVIIPRPLDARRFWERPPPNVDYVPPADNDASPVSPPPAQFSERRVSKPATHRRHQTRLSPPPPPPSDPEKQLACRNVSAPGERVRMVCE
ncbi:hypothetical protein HKB47_06795 [Mesorhizobium japonicum]|uniref:Lipoprotein n=4 Tax=Mesorhizobium TaxID=68287 RepID=A0A1A5JVF9_RHILI|nr:hypothetical protein [Mesorhizobium japonicum]OBP81055.1 hypothetical protein BAE42_05555 [Mesorhizobium loti]QGX76685.1 hypothetical protein EB234_06900 [Mesorhizobium japonicum R7A]RXT44050.1 hypothetical protein B5V01_19690 [Mesorhizobium erdmanii]MBE1715923.1 hypothetical protein [Mesorhizobium japonicum]